MNEPRKRKLWIPILFAVATCGLIGVSSYFIYDFVKRIKDNNNPTIIDSNWSKLPTGYKEFAENNFYKIEFQISDQNDRGFYYTQGTAWPWYYEPNLDKISVDWYLMTNFHVVNEVIAYKTGNITQYVDKNTPPKITQDNKPNLYKWYKNNHSLKFYSNMEPMDKCFFNLTKWDGKNYKEIFSNRKIKPNYVDIITDFDNPSLKLFSDEKNYNLDMAIIKINVPINIEITSNLNVVKNYEEIKQQQKLENYSFSNDSALLNKTSYISGFPSEAKKLVPVAIEKPNWTLRKSNLNGAENVLEYLRAPYFYSNLYKNFSLTSGSSGSACYQVDLINNSNSIKGESDLNYLRNLGRLYSSIPTGIYWGGSEMISSKDFKPSIIPFISTEYNIYEDFISLLPIFKNI